MDRFRFVPLIKAVYKLVGSSLGANREHDIAVHHKLDTIINESRMEQLLRYSFFTECLRSEERDLLYQFVNALHCAENQYLHPVIERRARRLARELSQLLQTVDSTFSSDDRELFRFRPDPLDPTAYDREWEKLQEGIESTWKAYKTYREAVKDRLKI
ncbi:MAG TPA: hypothetical protein VH681_14515 [Nitrospiraceae bacterium]|jgi:hypothetical protein